MDTNKEIGLTRVELTAIFFFAALFSLILYVLYDIQIMENSRQKKCQDNLKQLHESLIYYIAGNGPIYPQTNGGGFLVVPYQMGYEDILEKNFICPSTSDKTSSQLLLKLKAEDKEEVTSYAGRKNKNQRKYPGLYKMMSSALTTLASDDFQGSPNHSNGKEVNVLFNDGHIEILKELSAKENDYAIYANKTGWSSLDPLTN